MSKKVKNKYVLILCPGNSVKKYHDKITNIAKDDKVITIGINHIIDMFITDYHFWLDYKCYKCYGNFVDDKSTLIFSERVFKECDIKNCCFNKYNIFKFKRNNKLFNIADTEEFLNKSKKHLKIKKDFVSGAFETTGTLAIAWAHMKKASKISIVGMDGYTFYSKKELEKNKKSQHFYEKGYSGSSGSKAFKKIMTNYKKNNNNYNYYKMVDFKVFRTLLSLKRYGVKFQIITPTIYKDFYNSKILN